MQVFKVVGAWTLEFEHVEVVLIICDSIAIALNMVKLLRSSDCFNIWDIVAIGKNNMFMHLIFILSYSSLFSIPDPTKVRFVCNVLFSRFRVLSII